MKKGTYIRGTKNTATHCPQGHSYSGKNRRLNSKGSQYCGKCASIKVKQYTETHPEYRKRNAIKKHNNLDYYRKKSKEYHKQGKLYPKIIEWNKRNPEKKKAHYIIKRAIIMKRISKKPCQECGNLKVDAHHPDYSKPLKVIWLCRQHHKDLHKKLL